MLIDTASTENFLKVGTTSQLVTKSVAKSHSIKLNTLNSQGEVAVNLVRITLECKKGKSVERMGIQAYTVPHILTLPSVRTKMSKVTGITLNETFPRPEVDVDLLLGIKDLHKITSGHTVKYLQGFLLHTHWGYVYCGSVEEPKHDLTSCYLTKTEQLTAAVERMWKLDAMPYDNSSDTLKQSEVKAIEKIEQVLSFNSVKGKYETGLLFMDDPDLRNNYFAARKRFDSLYRKMESNKLFAEAYVKAMNEYKELGVVEVVDHDPQAKLPSRKDVFYLPHRAVWDPSRVSTKLRIVMDASAKTKSGKSLNDMLYAGPPLQLDIVTLLAKFRLRKYVLIGDISKMFLNIIMRTEDRDFLRFLWKEPGESGEPVIFRFNCVVFGAKDSPFQAITCLQKLAKSKLESASCNDLEKRVCNLLLNDVYVDDVIIGGDTEEELIEHRDALQTLLSTGHFFVRKWASNSPIILKQIPEEERAPTVILGEGVSAPHETICSADTKTLGVGWCPKTDFLTFEKYSSLKEDNTNTKTAVASLLSRLYDPLGLISPFVLHARFVMKQTFIEGINWKEALPKSLLPEWELWLNQLEGLANLKFPRLVKIGPICEYHVFCDASERGYGCAVYVRITTHSRRNKESANKYQSYLFMARSRIAPMKPLTIPRLELKGVLLGAEIGDFLNRSLGIDRDKIHFWTDSEIVLWWLTKDPANLVPFVANRIRKVQAFNFPNPFKHIATEHNPADIASRGCSVALLGGQMWQKGPDFLRTAKEEWPNPKTDYQQLETLEGVRKQNVFSLATQVAVGLELRLKANNATVAFIDYFSEYKDLMRRTAVLYLCVQNWKTRVSKPDEPRTVTPDKVHYEKAHNLWVRAAQESEFQGEIESITAGLPLSKSSKLSKLSPILDKEGILRVGGRIDKSEVSSETKHQIILPKGHPFTFLLARKVHMTNQHAGIDWTHFHLRQKYWILSSRQMIRYLVKRCIPCRKLNATRGQQLMAPLPQHRMKVDPAFTYVGVDYTGEITLRASHRSSKTIPAYVVLFCCLVTRCIHLECVLSNHTNEFLMAFKRMVNTRGMVSHLYSDNALTFKRAEKEIQETISRANQLIKDSAQQFSFNWHYSTELAPHTGGVWERMVKMVKIPVRKVLGKALVTYTELYTVLKEVEGLLNDRPLISASEETSEVITPSMLAIGRKIRPWPDGFEKVDIKMDPSIRERWRYRQALTVQCWNAWKKQYLPELQTRAKWFTKHPNLRVGDLVILEKEKIKRHNWPLARVVDVRKGRDGLIRSLRLQLPNVTEPITRSVHNVFPLEEIRENFD